MECLAVEFVSPCKKADYPSVRSLTARTVRGEFTVMARHEKSVMSLLPGFIVLKKEDGGEVMVLASGVTLTIKDNMCCVISEVFVLPEESSQEELRRFRDEVAKLTSSGGVIGELSRTDLRFIDMVLAK
ncbi:ATP synthase epsilon chain [Anaplasma platys]|uniref:ATP synthase epsilon chain n=2 Tax=Anaplasma platys TaxID=949 RepID=A0A858PY00_9RICK|nr:ATP synthase epsilon chain [Anaplasma platys]